MANGLIFPYHVVSVMTDWGDEEGKGNPGDGRPGVSA